MSPSLFSLSGPPFRVRLEVAAITCNLIRSITEIVCKGASFALEETKSHSKVLILHITIVADRSNAGAFVVRQVLMVSSGDKVFGLGINGKKLLAMLAKEA